MNKLKETRHKLGMSQQKLAEWFKRPQSSISKFETGRCKLSAEQLLILKKLCELKGIEFVMDDYINKKPS
jgi:ribosome-binding protein aMBF1 (putative translation factor)